MTTTKTTKMTQQKSSTPVADEVRSMVLAVVIALIIRTFLFQPFVIPSGSMKPNLLIGDFLFVSKYSYGFTKHSLPFSVPLFNGRVFGEEKPKIGDVVVFRGPFDPDTDYIKRVVGLPGDVVQMRDGILYINDEPSKIEPAGDFEDDVWTIQQRGQDDIRVAEASRNRHLPAYYETLPNGVKHLIIKKDKFGEGNLDNTQAYVVPEGHYFMVGDNRDESGDSRVLTQIGYVPQEHIIGKARLIFFSTTAQWWEIWKWPLGIRGQRLFKTIS